MHYCLEKLQYFEHVLNTLANLTCLPLVVQIRNEDEGLL